MAIFNYGNNILPNYGYNNGNMSSTTNMVNGVVYTQNVINLGGGNSCSGGPVYCQDGYSLYVPCLKNITRGQNVCFQLYIADNSNQDTLDLTKMCGLTLSLSGPFGCAYGDYTWPENISTLQRNSFNKLKCEEFNGNIYNLDLGYIELENNEFTEIELENVNTGDFTVNVKGVYGSFYKGETPYLEANDSPTHVFVGWTTDERINDICENFKTDDLIVSNEHIWNWETPLDRDMVIFAVYRKRKVYKVMIDFENRHSYFMVTYGEKTIMLSDKERDFIKVQEGHHFIVKCCPLISTNRNGEIIHTYNFYNWSDGNSYQTREYYANDNLFDDGILKLYAKCYEDKKSFNVSNEVIPTDDNFEMNLPVLNVLKKHVQQYVPNDNIIDFDKHKVNQIYDPDKDDMSYISIKKNGFITFNAENEIGKNINVVLHIDTTNIDFGENMYIPEPEDKIIISNGSQEISIGVTSPGDNQLTFEFENCEDSVFDIKTTMDELLINKICIFERNITNKGKIELCISPEDTMKFYRGVLNMSGAICVDDNWYGLDTVQIGNVNNIKPIEININQ